MHGTTMKIAMRLLQGLVSSPGVQENGGIGFELGPLLIKGQSVTLPTSVLLTFCGFTRWLREALCASHREWM